MPDIYSDKIEYTPLPKPAPPVLPKDFGPARDVKNAVYLNDYRNRCPFKSEDTNVDYEWVYGATMNLIFTITEDMTVRQFSYPFVVDVLSSGSSVVNPISKIANLPIGSMAYQSKDDYLDVAAVGQLVNTLMQSVVHTEHTLVEAGKLYKRISDKLSTTPFWPPK